MKKALILGTSDSQVDAIRHLKDAGWWVIACSYRREGRALDLTDQFELIDIANFGEIEALGRKENVDLLYSVGSGLAMPVVAKVASNLGLPTFISYQTAHLMQNKCILRKFLAARNISPVRYKTVRCLADLDGWTHFPAIVKPADSQGQRGVSRANCRNDLKPGFEWAIQFSGCNMVIVEEFLDGFEISASAFVIDRQVVCCAISDRLIAAGNSPYGIPRSHVFPTRNCDDQTLRRITSLVESCIEALAIENGPCYFQIKLTPKGPRIIEITPRLDGCHLWRLLEMGGGVNLLDATFKLLAGARPPNLKVRPATDCCRLNFLLSPPGKKFRKDEHPVPANAFYREYYYADGEIVRPINGSMDRVGYYVVAERS